MNGEQSFADRVKAFRHRHGLTQKAFCKKYPVPLSTLKHWEQELRGKKLPEMTIAFFTLIERETVVMDELLAKHQLVGKKNVSQE